MPNAKMSAASLCLRVAAVMCGIACTDASTRALAAGVPAGTVIENTATVTYELAGVEVSVDSNPTSITVAERIDVVVTRQSPQLQVQPGETNRALLFRVTNTGNGTEAFQLVLDSNVAGSDFNPVPASTSIYFDTDASGDLTPGDTAYQEGVNDPDLAPDASVDVFIVNDMPPSGPVNGDIGLSQLTANALTGTGLPGQSFPGQGDGNTDAVLGISGGSAAETGEYVIAGVEISVVKAQVVDDPFGGNEPVPGATVTYTVTVEVTSAGTATAAVFRDVVPEFTTYSPGTIILNGAPLTDVADADAAEIDSSSAPTVVVRLGDLTQADGPQVIEFRVTID